MYFCRNTITKSGKKKRTTKHEQDLVCICIWLIFFAPNSVLCYVCFFEVWKVYKFPFEHDSFGFHFKCVDWIKKKRTGWNPILFRVVSTKLNLAFVSNFALTQCWYAEFSQFAESDVKGFTYFRSLKVGFIVPIMH